MFRFVIFYKNILFKAARNPIFKKRLTDKISTADKSAGILILFF